MHERQRRCERGTDFSTMFDLRGDESVMMEAGSETSVEIRSVLTGFIRSSRSLENNFIR